MRWDQLISSGSNSCSIHTLLLHPQVWYIFRSLYLSLTGLDHILHVKQHNEKFFISFRVERNPGSSTVFFFFFYTHFSLEKLERDSPGWRKQTKCRAHANRSKGRSTALWHFHNFNLLSKNRKYKTEENEHLEKERNESGLHGNSESRSFHFINTFPPI